MTSRFLKSCLPLCVALSLWGCQDPAAQDEGAPPDAEDEVFVKDEASGKADAAGIEEMSWEGLCVLSFVNSASDDELLDVVHSFPGKNIIKARAGADGVLGSADDVGFATLEQLDEVRFVGRITFSQLSSHARSQRETYCLGLGQDMVLPGEQEAIQQIIARSEQEVLEHAARNDFARRDAHAKAHGCVKAFVDITPGALTPAERVGVFAKEATFPAWIRFSNGSPILQTDKERDVRGAALKLMGVPGEKILERHKTQLTHDFLFINGSTFFVRSPQDYVEFTSKTFDGDIISFFLNIKQGELRIRELFTVLDITGKTPRNPLRTRYWSTTPYMLGDDLAVKYSIKPCDGEEIEGRFDDDPGDLLRDSMQVHLSQTEGCFDFMIQRQLDPGEMPVEDSTLTWSEEDSPFIKVATVRVPMQEFGSPAQDEFCEDLSFNPWHALPEHRPLGNANRARRAVYDAISTLRHEFNQTPRAEPTSHDISN